MSTPLYSALIRHRDLHRSSFHTPGHKNNPAALPRDLYSLDFTELPDTDSLFDACGPILEAEKLAAKFFGTARTCLSAGGCTLCIQAMFRLAAPNGGKILCSRVIHRGAVNAMALLGLEPVWVMPRDIVPAIAANPDLKAVYVTSPNYYGQILDIASISAACKAKNVPLLVDSAHGAHLMFTEPKLHPLALGASMTADSAHKTLGVLTGGAWLNIADKRYADGAKQAMALFGSTSPAYPIMASLDLAREWFESHPGAFRPLQQKVAEVRRMAQELGISLPDGLCDPTRITLNTASVGLKGTKAAELFRSVGVEPEYADDAYLVLIATPFNTEQDFERVLSAVKNIPAGEPLPQGLPLPPLPPVACGLREAIFAESETVSLWESVGRIAAEAACPCPPGVPVTMPGERITKEASEFLRGYGFLRIKVLK
ncbi:MAG TPA: aminotransferase class I/II-fold pyridoxal phosphate-dependent enzyme [Caproicibacter sp.]|nr:aminotransferase class I/II-fold pyridoxal phosphate-dependent enzyme [Caproicibacter sp.]